MEQVVGDLLVLLFQIVLHRGYPMNLDADSLMDIAIGDALGQFGQFLGALKFQLRTDAIVGDLLQYTLDV